ncbi:hypothetical protein UFOVP225_7 [uncultured Caudovirales phage]|uniref:Gp5/Type VI secretion system Vgr protein OB-fold domain-containing protein n=1 Tax=uncultured Caudovirales phage TaxID=2100421 RepID=A0A6J7WM73_9CAUD|nr:hypothetical protein UFOVP113_20 [uncultured Caudovirales phage]CAB5218936.1 hypothetical protein UFOVP225_7 [uncultured Caudovirales phage]
MLPEAKYPGFYRAVVVDNADPKNLGRLKMMVPQVSGENVTDWAWPVLGGISQFKPVYGEWQADYAQTAASATVAYPVTLGTNDGTYGVGLENNSEIHFSLAGVYNIQFSFQFECSDTSDQDVTIWLRKNGVDVPGSAGFVSVPGKHGTTPGHCIAAWNYVLEFGSDDYFQLMWHVSSTTVSMPYYAAGTSPTHPTTASAILTVAAVGKVSPAPTEGVWAAFEGGDPNFPLWIGTF